MSEAIYRQNPNQQDYTPAGAVSSGEIVQLPDGRAAIIKTDLAASAKGAVYTKGTFDVLAATGTTFSAGDPVYWDASASLAITSPGAVDDLYLGTAVVAKTSGPLFVRVDLNEGLAGAGATGQRGVWMTRAIVVAHDDTAEHELVAATENPLGLHVVGFVGVVTEEPAGSSEDQLEITLYDEDDNALSVMITTDTTPDPADDIVVGTRALQVAVTGVVAAVIPAGKAAYAKVSQATAGTPAGEIRVSALVCPLL